MSDPVLALDPLVERLEGAARELRSERLSADAAARLVEDCAALAAQAAAELERLARAEPEEAGWMPARRGEGRAVALPGQDALPFP